MIRNDEIQLPSFAWIPNKLNIIELLKNKVIKSKSAKTDANK